MIRSNGARAVSSGESMPSATASSSSPGAVAELHAVDRRIVARDVDRDRVDVGGDAFRLGPQRQRGEGEQAGAGADVGDVGEARARRARAGRAHRGSRAVVACWPVPKARLGVDLEIDVPGGVGPRWVGVWTKKRPARIGCSPAWLIVTQSASPSCSTLRLAAAEAAQERRAPRRSGACVEISVDQPVVGLGRVGLVGDQHRRLVARSEQVVRVGQIASALRARAGEGDPPAHLRRVLPWPAARPAAWSVRPA